MKMPHFNKLVVLHRKREDIIGWYDSLEIPCNHKFSTARLVENLYQILQTNDSFMIYSKDHKRLSKQDLKWLEKFFDASLKYEPGPFYTLKDK